MFPSPFAFTPIERVAVETIVEERPEVVATLFGRLAPVVDELSRTSQGRVVTQGAAERLLLRLRDEFVARMMAELEPWGNDEDLREPAVDLLTRRLLAEARGGFVRRVVGATRN